MYSTHGRPSPNQAVSHLGSGHDSYNYLARLDWLRPHLRSLIGGYQLRLENRDTSTKDLRDAVEQMEQSHIKPPSPVLAAARARLDEANNAAKGQPPPSGR